MSRLRMAVIGVGHLGQHHARILAGLPDVELVGVVDPNAMQAREVAGRLGTTAYDHFEPLLGKVDAVTIVTPTVFHHQVAAAFLNAIHSGAGREAGVPHAGRGERTHRARR